MPSHLLEKRGEDGVYISQTQGASPRRCAPGDAKDSGVFQILGSKTPEIEKPHSFSRTLACKKADSFMLFHALFISQMNLFVTLNFSRVLSIRENLCPDINIMLFSTMSIKVTRLFGITWFVGATLVVALGRAQGHAPTEHMATPLQ